jgi:hypothetical protein
MVSAKLVVGQALNPVLSCVNIAIKEISLQRFAKTVRKNLRGLVCP